MLLKNPLVAMTLLTALILAGCAKKEEPKPQPATPPAPTGAVNPTTGVREPQFKWENIRGNFVNYYYEPTDSMRQFAQPMLSSVEQVYGFIAQFLGYTNPDSIEFFCYQSPAVLQQHSNQTEAFFVGNRIYFGWAPNTSFGKAVAEFVLGKLPEGDSKFAFMRAGIPMLLDFTGRNYHHATHNFLLDGTLIAVDSLLDNDAFARQHETKSAIEAASFCGFISYELSPQQLMMVFNSDEDIDNALKKATGVGRDDLYTRWKAFLPEHTEEKERAREQEQQQQLQQQSGGGR